jgi:hypothetical protein
MSHLQLKIEIMFDLSAISRELQYYEQDEENISEHLQNDMIS